MTRPRIVAAHLSLQFSDARRAQRHDLRRLFARASDRGYWWITGTEAGDDDLAAMLTAEAGRRGYRVHRWASVWVAVADSRITRPTSWETGHVPVLAAHASHTGPHGPRGIAWCSWTTKHLGRITVGAAHYLTNGRRPGDPNYDLNTRMTKAVGQWARERGRGRRLVFYGGDQNIGDRHLDTFRGQPLTTVWDDLGRHPDTGHGNIDVIARYDPDRRVQAIRARVLADAEFHLNTDHHLVEAVYQVRPLS